MLNGSEAPANIFHLTHNATPTHRQLSSSHGGSPFDLTPSRAHMTRASLQQQPHFPHPLPTANIPAPSLSLALYDLPQPRISQGPPPSSNVVRLMSPRLVRNGPAAGPSPAFYYQPKKCSHAPMNQPPVTLSGRPDFRASVLATSANQPPGPMLTKTLKQSLLLPKEESAAMRMNRQTTMANIGKGAGPSAGLPRRPGPHSPAVATQKVQLKLANPKKATRAVLARTSETDGSADGRARAGASREDRDRAAAAGTRQMRKRTVTPEEEDSPCIPDPSVLPRPAYIPGPSLRLDSHSRAKKHEETPKQGGVEASRGAMSHYQLPLSAQKGSRGGSGLLGITPAPQATPDTRKRAADRPTPPPPPAPAPIYVPPPPPVGQKSSGKRQTPSLPLTPRRTGQKDKRAEEGDTDEVNAHGRKKVWKDAPRLSLPADSRPDRLKLELRREICVAEGMVTEHDGAYDLSPAAERERQVRRSAAAPVLGRVPEEDGEEDRDGGGSGGEVRDVRRGMTALGLQHRRHAMGEDEGDTQPDKQQKHGSMDHPSDHPSVDTTHDKPHPRPTDRHRSITSTSSGENSSLNSSGHLIVTPDRRQKRLTTSALKLPLHILKEAERRPMSARDDSKRLAERHRRETLCAEVAELQLESLSLERDFAALRAQAKRDFPHLQTRYKWFDHLMRQRVAPTDHQEDAMDEKPDSPIKKDPRRGTGKGSRDGDWQARKDMLMMQLRRQLAAGKIQHKWKLWTFRRKFVAYGESLPFPYVGSLAWLLQHNVGLGAEPADAYDLAEWERFFTTAHPDREVDPYGNRYIVQKLQQQYAVEAESRRLQAQFAMNPHAQGDANSIAHAIYQQLTGVGVPPAPYIEEPNRPFSMADDRYRHYSRSRNATHRPKPHAPHFAHCMSSTDLLQGGPAHHRPPPVHHTQLKNSASTAHFMDYPFHGGHEQWMAVPPHIHHQHQHHRPHVPVPCPTPPKHACYGLAPHPPYPPAHRDAAIPLYVPPLQTARTHMTPQRGDLTRMMVMRETTRPSATANNLSPRGQGGGTRAVMGPRIQESHHYPGHGRGRAPLSRYDSYIALQPPAFHLQPSPSREQAQPNRVTQYAPQSPRDQQQNEELPPPAPRAPSLDGFSGRPAQALFKKRSPDAQANHPKATVPRLNLQSLNAPALNLKGGSSMARDGAKVAGSTALFHHPSTSTIGIPKPASASGLVAFQSYAHLPPRIAASPPPMRHPLIYDPATDQHHHQLPHTQYHGGSIGGAVQSPRGGQLLQLVSGGHPGQYHFFVAQHAAQACMTHR